MYSTVYVQLSIATDWQSMNILFDSCINRKRRLQRNAHALSRRTVGSRLPLGLMCAAHGSLFFILNSESQIQEYVYKNVLYS